MKEINFTKKHILVIAGGNYVSGAEKVTLDVIQGLKQAGHNLFCITSGWTDGDFAQHLSKIKIGYKQFKLGWYYLTNLKWSFDSLIHYPKAFIEFYKFSKSHRYDVIYTMSFRYIVLLYPLIKSNVIYHVHDPSSHSRQSRFFIKRIDKKVAKYIAVSDFIKKDLINCGINAGKIEIIHNGTSVLQPNISNLKKDNTLTLGIVGQIIQRKGHEDVIQSLKILREQSLNITLVIVGKGDMKFIEELKGLVSRYNLESAVEWRSFKTDVYDIYENINVVLAPTRNDEPFGLIAIEANMLSLPVIVSKKGGLVEIVFEGFNGFIVEANNPEQIAEKVSILYYNRRLIKEFGERGRTMVLKKFTKEKMIFKIEQLIQQV